MDELAVSVGVSRRRFEDVFVHVVVLRVVTKFRPDSHGIRDRATPAPRAAQACIGGTWLPGQGRVSVEETPLTWELL
jgi:hypothetical protein